MFLVAGDWILWLEDFWRQLHMSTGFCRVTQPFPRWRLVSDMCSDKLMGFKTTNSPNFHRVVVKLWPGPQRLETKKLRRHPKVKGWWVRFNAIVKQSFTFTFHFHGISHLEIVVGHYEGSILELPASLISTFFTRKKPWTQHQKIKETCICLCILLYKFERK